MPVKPGPPPLRIFAPTTAWQPLASSRVSETLVAWPVKVAEPAGNSWVRLIGAGLAADVCTVTVTATPSTLQPVNAILVRAPIPVPLRPRPDLKLPVTASPEQMVTWLDTASRMPTVEPAACVPDQGPPGETVNVVAASAGAARRAADARVKAGRASRPVLYVMVPTLGTGADLRLERGWNARLTSGHREGRLPPPRCRLEFDAVDPLDPPVPAPARRDQAQRVSVARGQGSAADVGGQQQAADVAHREADPVPGDGVHEQAPGLTGAGQQGLDRHAAPVLPGVPAGGAVQRRPHPDAGRHQLVKPQLVPAGSVHHGQPPPLRVDGRDRVHQPARDGHRVRIERTGLIRPGEAPVSAGEAAQPDRLARREVKPGCPRAQQPGPQEGPPRQIRPPRPDPPGHEMPQDQGHQDERHGDVYPQPRPPGDRAHQPGGVADPGPERDDDQPG